MSKISDFFLKNQTLRQTIFKNTFWLFVGNVVGRLIRAIVVLYAARALGAEGYGIFSYALGFAALFAIVGDFGMDTLLVREGSRENSSNKEEILSAIFYFKLFIELATYAVLIFVAMNVVPVAESRVLIPLLGLAFMFDSFRQFGFAIIKSTEKMEVEAGIYILSQTATVVVGLIALIVWKTPFALAAAYAIGGSVGVIAVSFYLKKILLRIRSLFHFSVLKKLLKDAWPFAFLGLTGVILVNTDTVMLGWLSTAEHVGYYSAAFKPVQLLFVVPTMFTASLFPALTRKAENNTDKSMVEKAVAMVMLLAIPITIGGFLLPDFVIGTLYGIEYLPAIAPFTILVFIILLNYPGTVMGYTISAHNKQAKVLKYFALAALINVALNYLFILRWGLLGAATASLISQAIATFGYYMITRKLMPLRLTRNLPKPLFAAVIMGGGIVLLRQTAVPLVLIFLLSIGVYFLILKLLRDPIFSELASTLKVLRRQ